MPKKFNENMNQFPGHFNYQQRFGVLPCFEMAKERVCQSVSGKSASSVPPDEWSPETQWF